MKLQHGQVLTKHEVKRTGNDKQTLVNESQTEVLGPFSVAEIHAEVRASLRVTISENYHSATLECAVMLPVDPTADATQHGYEWAHDFCTRNINEKMKGVRKGLRNLAQNA